VVPTFFINDGSRTNNSSLQDPTAYEEKGIYVALVGARFEKKELMEWQHMIVTQAQNTRKNGFGLRKKRSSGLLALWERFYTVRFATFTEARLDTSGRFIRIHENEFLDTLVYKKRMRMVIEPFLIEANRYGALRNKKVYVHAVGLGLGVWQISPIQAKLMLEVYADILNLRHLPHIADLNFSWFAKQYHTCGGIGDGERFKNELNDIVIHFSTRNPAAKLTGHDSGKLLVAMYAWDANAMPGNEYWIGSLDASGDPAAACCSLIAELQNPLINPNIAQRSVFLE
jgi:hypothetical protein